MKECNECGKESKPAPGYLGGPVMCKECVDELIEENTI